MLTKSEQKRIVSLGKKKFRKQHGQFIVEGVKSVHEFITNGYVLDTLIATQAIATEYSEFLINHNIVPVITDARTLQQLTQLTTAPQYLAVFKLPEVKGFKADDLMVGLDGVRDPGNLGTIIRLCDWYGITEVVCSLDTVDCYNPKVVQASMGSLARVQVKYMDLIDFKTEHPEIPFYATAMDGESIYTTTAPTTGVIVLGNEANGISQEVFNASDRRITIPRYRASGSTESLNVAMATGIILSQFRKS